MKGTGYEVSYPLAVVGVEKPNRLTLRVEVFDQEAWDRVPDAMKSIHYDTAAKYGKIEIVKRMAVATITRVEA